MTNQQVDVILDVYESCKSIRYAWEQQEAAERDGSTSPEPAFNEALEALSELFEAALAIGVGEALLTKIALDFLPSGLVKRLNINQLELFVDNPPVDE